MSENSLLGGHYSEFGVKFLRLIWYKITQTIYTHVLITCFDNIFWLYFLITQKSSNFTPPPQNLLLRIPLRYNRSTNTCDLLISGRRISSITFSKLMKSSKKNPQIFFLKRFFIVFIKDWSMFCRRPHPKVVPKNTHMHGFQTIFRIFFSTKCIWVFVLLFWKRLFLKNSKNKIMYIWGRKKTFPHCENYLYMCSSHLHGMILASCIW